MVLSIGGVSCLADIIQVLRTVVWEDKEREYTFGFGNNDTWNKTLT